MKNQHRKLDVDTGHFCSELKVLPSKPGVFRLRTPKVIERQSRDPLLNIFENILHFKLGAI